MANLNTLKTNEEILALFETADDIAKLSTAGLLKTDGAGDISVATEGTDYMAPYVVVNENLLDNAYFVGGGSQQGGGQFPLNSRRATSYAGSTKGIDRWQAYNNIALSVGADYITLTPASAQQTWLQNVPADIPNGTPYTVSVFTDKGLFTATAVMPNVAICYATTDTGSYTCFYQPSSKTFRIYNSTASSGVLNLKACKLELGPKQTLGRQVNGVWVLNEIPNFAEEVARCNPVHTYNLGTLSANASITLDPNTGIYSSVETQIRATQGGAYTITLTAPTGYTITDGDTSGSSLVLTPTTSKTIEISAKTISDSVIAVITKEW